MASIALSAWVFLGVATVFYMAVAVKSILKLKLCGICLAVSTSWVALLACRWLGWLENDTIIALLMGMSVVGGYYWWERRVSQDLLVFRLPVLLSLALLAWYIVVLNIELAPMLVVVTVWISHGLLYMYRNHPVVRSRVDKIIACCSSW